MLKRLIMTMLPPSVRARAREMRQLEGRARRAHIAMTLRRLGSGPDASFPSNAGAKARALFVCHGNIIRSAMAEALYRRHVTHIAGVTPRVRSAGVGAIDGRPADPRAQSAAATLGATLIHHRSQLLTQALVDEADVIYVMDRLNEAEVLARFSNARSKLRRLGALAPDPADGDIIPDPYSLDEDAVAASGMRIDEAIRELATRLVPPDRGVRK